MRVRPIGTGKRSRVALAATVACGLGASGCETSGPVPVITQVEPTRVYSDQPTRLTIRGGPFLPRWTLDDDGQRADALGYAGAVSAPGQQMPLVDFEWRSPNELGCTLPAGLPAQIYDVTVIDPRGQRVTAPRSFETRGPDTIAPAVTILAPTSDTLAAAGMTLSLRATAADQAPGQLERIDWRAFGAGGVFASGSCEAKTVAATCEAKVSIPSTFFAGQTIELAVEATDRAAKANTSMARVRLDLLPLPVVRSVTPTEGAAQGGTDLVVVGEHFVRGTKVFLGEVALFPGGGILVGSTVISGHAPPQPPGPVPLRIVSPLGELRFGEFAYRPAPQVTRVSPAIVSAAGGARLLVTGRGFTEDTQIYFGAALAVARPLDRPERLSDELISGFAPPGMGIGTVWAVDARFGTSALPSVFAWTQAAESAP